MIEEYNLDIYRRKAEICKSFADPKRLMIINELRDGEKPVGYLVDALQVPQAVISRHLAVLRNRGVVVARRKGVNIYYSIADPKIIEACDIVHDVLLGQVEKDKKVIEQWVT